jgi:hypothetical protein
LGGLKGLGVFGGDNGGGGRDGVGDGIKGRGGVLGGDTGGGFRGGDGGLGGSNGGNGGGGGDGGDGGGGNASALDVSKFNCIALSYSVCLLLTLESRKRNAYRKLHALVLISKYAYPSLPHEVPQELRIIQYPSDLLSSSYL